MLPVAVFVALAATSRVHVEAAGVRSAIETFISLMAMLSAVLVGVGFKRTQRTQDLLVLGSLATVSLIDIAFNTLPAIGEYELGVHAMGARLAGMLLSTMAFTAAALAPVDRRAVRTGPRLVGFALVAGLCVVAGAEVLELVLGTARTTSINAFRPAVEVVAGLSGTGLLLAAGMFATRRRDAQAPLLAGVAFLLAAVSLQRMFLPVESSEWVTPGDLARVAAYGLWLLAALRLYGDTRADMAAAALRAERTRIAHDLHDGLAQDLALIAAHRERLERAFGAGHPVVTAAQRALAASRGQIVELVADAAPSTEEAMRNLATDLGRRYDVVVRVSADGEDATDFSPLERKEILRIAREAIFNAAYHGHARAISVTLGSRRSERLLSIVDDGCGVGSAAAAGTAGTGLGVSAMRMRARRLGARLTVTRCGEAGGTHVEVVLAAGRE